MARKPVFGAEKPVFVSRRILCAAAKPGGVEGKKTVLLAHEVKESQIGHETPEPEGGQPGQDEKNGEGNEGGAQEQETVTAELLPVQVGSEQGTPDVADVDADDDDSPHPEGEWPREKLFGKGETDDPGGPHRQAEKK